MRVGHQPGASPEVGSSKKNVRGTHVGESKRIDKDNPNLKIEGRAAKGMNSDVKADLSPKSKEFVQAKAVAHSAPDIREDKVADLKRRIADKSYQVDSDAIADRLVDEHLRLPERD